MTDFNIFNTEASAEKGATLHLLHPVTSEPAYADDEKTKELTIEMMGSESKLYQKKAQERYNNSRRGSVKLKNKDDTVDFDEALDFTIEDLVDMTMGWSNIMHDGKSLAFNKKNAELLYSTYKEVRSQATRFMESRANFIKG